MSNCKYEKEQKIVSYNGGEDWQNVMPEEFRKGDLIETDSSDCDTIDTIYRWRVLDGIYLCEDNVKFEKEIMDESYDGGLTWYPSYPTQYRKGNEVGYDADYCEYKGQGHYDITGDTSCPEGYIWNGRECVRLDGGYLDPMVTTKCNGNNTVITSADTVYPASQRYGSRLASFSIGSCATAIGDYAFSGRTSLTSCTVAAGSQMTTIGKGAFYGCSGLTSFNIPSGVTTIGDSAFYLITFESVTIPSSVTSIGNYAFTTYDYSLKYIVSEAATPPSIGDRTFGNDLCSIIAVYVPSGSVEAYKSAQYWSSFGDRIMVRNSDFALRRFKYYNNCWNANDLPCEELVSGDTLTSSAITSSGYSDIQHAVVGNCAKVIDNGAFSGRTRLQTCELHNNILRIGASAFTGCYRLHSITIPSGISGIYDSTFKGCSGMTSVTFPDSLQEIGQNSFSGCSSLQELHIPSGLTTIASDAFRLCTGLTSITVDEGNTKYDSRFNCNAVIQPSTETDDIYLFMGCQNTIIPGNVKIIDPYAFYRCGGNTYWITIPNSVTNIGDYAFYYSSFGGSKTINASTIGFYAFYNCASLTSILLGSNVSNIGSHAFYGGLNLTSITIEATTPPTIGSSVFDNTNNCPIYVPCESVDAYKSAWPQYADRIQQCTTPKWIATYSDSSVTSAECDSTSEIVQNEINTTNLVSLEIGDCVTSIGDYAFTSCSGLTSCTIGSDVTSIGEMAFRNCNSLTSITIPNSVTRISYGAFIYCTSLTSIDIPSGVTSIGSYAFRYCSGLTSVTVEATTPPSLGGTSVFADTNNCPIYVPASSVEAYKTATNWSTYADRIQAIT